MLKIAGAAIRDLKKVGIQARADLNSSFWMRVGKLKGEIRKVSLADCFAIELSRKLSGQIVTSDHHEFDPLAVAGLCRVRFIR